MCSLATMLIEVSQRAITSKHNRAKLAMFFWTSAQQWQAECIGWLCKGYCHVFFPNQKKMFFNIFTASGMK